MPSTSSNNTLWALVDCNNFYASCETLFRPDLADKPVVVLSNNDGCIVSRSREAKALGIPMGEPEFKARGMLRQHKVTVFSSNYALYGDISARVMATMEDVCGAVEPYSIDEAFIRIEGASLTNVEALTQHLRTTVQRWTGITVSVGVAPTRTLAKLANHLAKKGHGICLLPNEGPQRDAALRGVPVAEVWGIGKRQARKLYEIGITNTLELREANDAWVRKHLTITGWKTVLELRGMPCIDEGEGPVPRRTLVSSRSFGQKIFDKLSLQQAVASFTVRGAERLRRERLVAGGMAVQIRTARHDEMQVYDVTGQRKFAQSCADTGVMLETAQRILDSLFKEGPAYAKAGIMLYDLAPQGQQQGSLLAVQSPQDDARREALMRTLDCINTRFGRDGIRFGAQGPDNAPWHMRQKNVSPRVTTLWDEIATAVCK